MTKLCVKWARRRCIIWTIFALSLFSAITTQAQVSSLDISFDAPFGGLGQATFLTSADGHFSAQSTVGSSHADIIFSGSTDFWLLSFAAPQGQPLAVGTYTGAERDGFQAPSEPGLDVEGNGAACNTLTGNFTISELTYGSDGNLASFDAIFEQHCGPSNLQGEVRFNAHPVVNLTAPTHLSAFQNQNVTFTVTATDASSRHVVLTATSIPGAIFTDNGDNTGTFLWTPDSTQQGSFVVTFQGDDQAGNVAVAPTRILVTPQPPPNDDFNNPTVITTVPTVISQDVNNATVAPDDPFCVTRGNSVWFAFTPTQNMRLEVNTFDSNYDTTLSVYTGVRGALNQIACNDDSEASLLSKVRFDAVAGITYYFEVSSFTSFVGQKPRAACHPGSTTAGHRSQRNGVWVSRSYVRSSGHFGVRHMFSPGNCDCLRTVEANS